MRLVGIQICDLRGKKKLKEILTGKEGEKDPEKGAKENTGNLRGGRKEVKKIMVE